MENSELKQLALLDLSILDFSLIQKGRCGWEFEESHCHYDNSEVDATNIKSYREVCLELERSE